MLKVTYLFCPIVSKSFTTIAREDEKSNGIPLRSNSKICSQKGFENKKVVESIKEHNKMHSIACRDDIFTHNSLSNYSIL